MVYGCLLAYLAIVYIRPGEIIPGWIGFPFLQIASIACVIAALVSLILEPRKFWDRPIDWFVLAFFGVAVLSNPANGWFGGASLAFQSFGPVVFCYFLMRVAVRTSRQLHGVVLLIVALTLFQAGNAIVQRRTGVGLGNVTAFARNVGEEGAEAGSDDQPDTRARGSGIFNDPNDLAMTLIIAIPFLLTATFGRLKPAGVRLLAAAGLTANLTALSFTLSRGGLLGSAAALAHFAKRRWGRTASAVVIVVALAGTAAMSSRLGQWATEEDSAQGRIQAWSAGLQMFKLHPLVGVGYGQFTEYNELVAHNSFVHSLAELGTVGGIAFVGLFYLFFSMTKPSTSELACDVRGSGIGMLTALMFLSRQYNVIPYIVLGVAACLPLEVADRHGDRERTGTKDDATAANVAEPQKLAGVDLVRIVAITLAAIVATYVTVRVLAVWSH